MVLPTFSVGRRGRPYRYRRSSSRRMLYLIVIVFIVIVFILFRTFGGIY